jgi:hypothetical protein
MWRLGEASVSKPGEQLRDGVWITTALSEVSEGLKRKLDLVLEDTCQELPHGGDHETRKIIAAQLLEAAQAGHVTLGEPGDKLRARPSRKSEEWMANANPGSKQVVHGARISLSASLSLRPASAKRLRGVSDVRFATVVGGPSRASRITPLRSGA